MNRLLTIAIAALAAGMAMQRSAAAQSLPTPMALPTLMVEEVLVKTSLLTLNDANLTGNYTVMHAKMAKVFRDRFTVENLKQGFKVFAGQHMDLIAAKPIVPSSEAKIDKGTSKNTLVRSVQIRFGSMSARFEIGGRQWGSGVFSM